MKNTALFLVLILSNSTTGEPEAILNSLDQGGAEVPIDAVTINGDSMQVSGSSLGLSIKGIVDLNEETWTTTFKQGTAVFPLIFHKVDRLPGQKRPQEPKPPLPYHSEDVVYENSEAGISLAGTLTIPEGTGPFPAVILLSGKGIAVLRSDDRGVGGSGGSFEKATTGDFADDALAGIKFLETIPKINKDLIGLAGHSEGGMMAPIAAAKSASVDFIVLMAAPGIPFDQVILFQKKTKWIEAGMGEEYIDLLIKWHMNVSGLVKSDLSNSLVENEINRMYSCSSAENLAILHRGEETMEDEIKMAISPWWRYASK